MKFCPNCGFDLTPHLAIEGNRVPGNSTLPAVHPTTAEAYDQTDVWKKLMASALEREATPPSSIELTQKSVQELQALAKLAGGKPVDTVVHLVFDRNIAPSGGGFASAVLGGRNELNIEQMKAQGYVVEDGKIATHQDIPVGAAFQVIDYWGGERQSKRWHLAAPVALVASRNGDPFFMDERMAAFGALWSDVDKAEEAMLTLLGAFSEGVGGDGIVAHVLELKITERKR
jgi:hypothetical protein